MEAAGAAKSAYFVEAAGAAYCGGRWSQEVYLLWRPLEPHHRPECGGEEICGFAHDDGKARQVPAVDDARTLHIVCQVRINLQAIACVQRESRRSK